MPVDFYRIMKIIFCCPAFLLLLSCCDRPEAAFDPRSVQYNDRAVEMMHSFIREGTLDTTGFSDAVTLADSSRIMFGSIVDSCQALLDSAVMYSPDYYLYYAQKAFFTLIAPIMKDRTGGYRKPSRERISPRYVFTPECYCTKWENTDNRRWNTVVQ